MPLIQVSYVSLVKKNNNDKWQQWWESMNKLNYSRWVAMSIVNDVPGNGENFNI